MNIFSMMEHFSTEQQCIAHLVQVRWDGKVRCTKCYSQKVCTKAEATQKSRWQCWNCKRSFSVTEGTIFHRTRMPLTTWFMALALIVNAKKSVSSCQIARDLGINQKTAWRMDMCIRKAMATPAQGEMLKGIVEMDETDVGGKPRKGNKRDDDTPSKRGRGTSKTAVVGVVQRKGNVYAEPVKKLTGKSLESILRKVADVASTHLYTDEFPS